MTALTPHHEKFKAIYQPIRHKVFAHRGMEGEQAIVTLFSQTLITDVAEILRFLHTLVNAIWDMAWNGRRPELTDYHRYDRYVAGLTEKTTSFVRQLP